MPVSAPRVLPVLVLLCVAWQPPGAARAADGWTWPVSGDVVTPYSYGLDRFAPGQHRGVDIGAHVGTPVVAARGGAVRFAGSVGSAGLTVALRTADGRFDTSYLHLASTSVAAGDRVATGEPIGTVGVSGSPSSARPHLHFGVRGAGSRHDYRDPLTFLAPPPARGREPDRPPLGAPAPVVPRPVRFASRPAPAVRRQPIDIGWALACLASIALAAVVGRSSIGGSCRTTSQPRSTTSTASPTWATSTRR